MEKRKMHITSTDEKDVAAKEVMRLLDLPGEGKTMHLTLGKSNSQIHILMEWGDGTKPAPDYSLCLIIEQKNLVESPGLLLSAIEDAYGKVVAGETVGTWVGE